MFDEEPEQRKEVRKDMAESVPSPATISPVQPPEGVRPYINTINFEYDGINVNFPIMVAAKSLGDLDKVIKDYVISPWLEQARPDQPVPQSYGAFDKQLVMQTIRALMPLIRDAIAKLPNFDKSQELHYAQDVFQSMLTQLATHYSQQMESKSRQRNLMQALQAEPDLRMFLERANPQTRQIMEGRASNLMQHVGAADANQNIVSEQLYRRYVGNIKREWYNILEQYQGREALINLQQQQKYPQSTHQSLTQNPVGDKPPEPTANVPYRHTPDLSGPDYSKWPQPPTLHPAVRAPLQ